MQNAKWINKGRFTNPAVLPCFEWAIQLHHALRRKPAPAVPKVNKNHPNPSLLTGFGVHSGGRVHSLCVCWNMCENVGKQLPGLGSRGTDASDIFICTTEGKFSSSMLESFNLCIRLGQMKNSSHFYTCNKETHPMLYAALGFCPLSYTLLPGFPKSVHSYPSLAFLSFLLVLQPFCMV